MLNLIVYAIFSLTPQQEMATKNYWIKFNDIIHKFNKNVNEKPNTAAEEIKQTIAKIRSMSIKDVDSMVIKYAEKRIALATEYADFLDSIKISDDILYKVDFPIKNQKNKIQNLQKKYQDLYDMHKNMDLEQQILMAYLKEKYMLDAK